MAEVATLVANGVDQAAQSYTSYSKARTLFEEELGIKDLKFQKQTGYTAQFSAAMKDGRIDPDYFRPEHKAIRSSVTGYPCGYERLLDCCDALRPNIDSSRTPKHVFDYVELSNIDTSVGLVEGAVPAMGADLPSRARRQVRSGDVIASSVVGSIDKAAAIAEAQNDYIASTGFFHLRPRTVSTEYLLLLVRSLCVRMQFLQQATGGILSAVPDSRLKHVVVPRLPASLQQEISGLVAKAHAAKRKSRELLEQAKARVEQLVERAVQH